MQNLDKNLEFTSQLKDILSKYQLEPKKEEIVRLIIESYINGKITEFDIANEISQQITLDFNSALDLSYDIVFKLIPSLSDEIKKRMSLTAEKSSEFKEVKLNDVLAEIKNSIGLEIENSLEKRFEDIIYNWFRDIRDDTETIDMLSRSPKIGGLGLDYNQAEDLIDILKKKKTEYLDRGVDILALITDELAKAEPAIKGEEVKEEEIDVSARAPKVFAQEEKVTGAETTIDQLLKEKNIGFAELSQKEKIKRQLGDIERVPEVQGKFAKEIIEKEEFLGTKEELPPPSIVPSPEEKIPEKPREIFFSKPPVVEGPPIMPTPPAPVKTLSQPIETRQSFIKKTEPATRPRLEDVKFESKLYSPIDELAAFTIADLRRLSKDPKVAVSKIISKLELLEDESIAKKVEGIKVLKSSPLYKVYASLMNQALMQSKSFEQIIAGNPVISLLEFKAIMELNKSLKY